MMVSSIAKLQPRVRGLPAGWVAKGLDADNSRAGSRRAGGLGVGRAGLSPDGEVDGVSLLVMASLAPLVWWVGPERDPPGR